MKKNIVIITINDLTNYGNRLQNYALTTILSKYGSISTAKCELSSDNVFRRCLKPIKRAICNFFDYFLEFLNGSLSLNITKRRRFANFTKRYANDELYSVTFKHGLSPHDSVSRIVLGSDQIWNYRWISKRSLSLRLGAFQPDNIPIISYAASFGVSAISKEVEPIFQKFLPRLNAISVREDQGAKLIKEMTGLDAAVVLDPTLMLSAEQWNHITRGFVADNDLYVLTYFLGRPSEAQEQTIQDYATAYGFRIRRMLDLRNRETYAAGPQDFVELFSKAQYVFTDSYHACCFSILFHKQFTVFNRAGADGKANMNSRMETLFRLFELDSVVMDEGMAPQIDYAKVDQLLAQHRAESQAWLDNALMEE